MRKTPYAKSHTVIKVRQVTWMSGKKSADKHVG